MPENRQTNARENDRNVNLPASRRECVKHRFGISPPLCWFNGIPRERVDARVSAVCARTVCAPRGGRLIYFAADQYWQVAIYKCWDLLDLSALRYPLITQPSALRYFLLHPPARPALSNRPPLRFAPLRLAHISTLQSQRGLGTSLVIIVNWPTLDWNT